MRYRRHYTGTYHKTIFGSLRKCYEDGLTDNPKHYNKYAVKNAEIIAIYYLDINENWKAYVTCYMADGQYKITIQSNNLDEQYGKWYTNYTHYTMGNKNDANDRFKSIVEMAKTSGMASMKRMK